jgi:hypothetical protein
VGENVADVGVGDLLGPRWERVMERLQPGHGDELGVSINRERCTYPMELKNDMAWY